MISKQLGNDVISFESLDELAKILAINQNNYSDVMKSAMKYSKVKENILNISRMIRTNSSDILEKSFVDGIDNIHSHKRKNNHPRLKQLISGLSRDINIYFPVEEQRNNVLNKNQDYWVVFSTPIHGDDEYFVTGYNKNGESKQFSSKIPPIENILVIAYSERQERYSPNLLPCEDCDDGGGIDQGPIGGGTPPAPVVYYEGLRFTKMRTKDVDDGWLDGDIEVFLSITQTSAVGSINGSWPYSVAGSVFIEGTFDHDAGTWSWDWYQFIYTNSNKWTEVNFKRKLSERQVLVQVGSTIYYQDAFNIQITEEDPVSNDELAKGSFDLRTFSKFGQEWAIKENSVFIVLDKGLFTF